MIDLLAPCLVYLWIPKLKKYIPSSIVSTYYEVEQLRSFCLDDSFITCPVHFPFKSI